MIEPRELFLARTFTRFIGALVFIRKHHLLNKLCYYFEQNLNKLLVIREIKNENVSSGIESDPYFSESFEGTNKFAPLPSNDQETPKLLAVENIGENSNYTLEYPELSKSTVQSSTGSSSINWESDFSQNHLVSRVAKNFCLNKQKVLKF